MNSIRFQLNNWPLCACLKMIICPKRDETLSHTSHTLSGLAGRKRQIFYSIYIKVNTQKAAAQQGYHHHIVSPIWIIISLVLILKSPIVSSCFAPFLNVHLLLQTLPRLGHFSTSQHVDTIRGLITNKQRFVFCINSAGLSPRMTSLLVQEVYGLLTLASADRGGI